MTTVLVLGGGPDAEREVSLASSQAVAGAVAQSGRFKVAYHVVDAPGVEDLGRLPGDVIFPVLHGAFGEGGPLQDAMALDGRPFVGSRGPAARVAMDKMASKLIAAGAGVPTASACVVNADDAACPLDLPVVVKPNNDGSSVGLEMCRTVDEWDRAHARVRDALRERPGRAWMVERLIPGRELTVGLMGGPGGLEALPVVEVAPKQGTYDYAAKYERADTVYTVSPELPVGVSEKLGRWSVAVSKRIGVRHLGRADFILPAGGEPMFLEVNTMPGFTGTSLLPKAAAAVGVGFSDLCCRLVDLALES